MLIVVEFWRRRHDIRSGTNLCDGPVPAWADRTCQYAPQPRHEGARGADHLLALAFGTRATPANMVQTAAIVAPAVLAAALGVLAAISLRTHRLIQPTILLTALGSYFASGGFIPVPALPPLAREVAAWWPASYVFEWANPVLHGFATHPSLPSIAAPTGALLISRPAALIASQHDYRTRPANGQ